MNRTPTLCSKSLCVLYQLLATRSRIPKRVGLYECLYVHFILFVPCSVDNQITQYSVQQIALYCVQIFCIIISYKAIQHVSIPNGIIIRGNLTLIRSPDDDPMRDRNILD
jgi:hypothetical protein